jgi:hypothetical protein
MDHHYMLATRTLIFATAASLLGAGFVATNSATAGPVPCQTKRCVDQPPPRLCSTVQAELDQVAAEIAHPSGSGGLRYSLGQATGIRGYYAWELANTRAALALAQQTVADLLANPPAYADIPAVNPPLAPLDVVMVGLDRQALWEYELATAQGEVNRLTAEETVLFNEWSTADIRVQNSTAALNNALARQQALSFELKTCVYRIG